VLDGQLLHYWSLHERHGVDYAYLVVSIDDGAALRKRLGSARWDRLVERAGTAVRRSVRASDTCAAVDFDRFGVLLPHTTLAPALTVAERVRASLAKVGVSVSVGAADAASTGGVTDVRAASEAALYAALAKTPRGAIGPPAHALPPAKPRFFPGAEGAGDENTLLEAHEHGARKRATLEAARTTL
jgi:GGDEF domain-containing protein